MASCKADKLLFSSGFILLIYSDSEISRSSLLEKMDSTVKSWSVKGWSWAKLWSRMAENGGLESGKRVRTERPLCSKILCLSQRVLEPIYRSLHCEQVNKYTTPEFRSIGRAGLSLSKDPTVKGLVKTNWNLIWGKVCLSNSCNFFRTR